MKIKGDSHNDKETAAMYVGYRLWKEATLTDTEWESQIRPLVWKVTWEVEVNKDKYQDHWVCVGCRWAKWEDEEIFSEQW